jgi:hypothetical protein
MRCLNIFSVRSIGVRGHDTGRNDVNCVGCSGIPLDHRAGVSWGRQWVSGAGSLTLDPDLQYSADCGASMNVIVGGTLARWFSGMTNERNLENGIREKYSARPKWLPYADGRLLKNVGDHREVIGPEEELQIIWLLVDNNICDFGKAERRWNLLWDRLQKRATLPQRRKDE